MGVLRGVDGGGLGPRSGMIKVGPRTTDRTETLDESPDASDRPPDDPDPSRPPVSLEDVFPGGFTLSDAASARIDSWVQSEHARLRHAPVDCSVFPTAAPVLAASAPVLDPQLEPHVAELRATGSRHVVRLQELQAVEPVTVFAGESHHPREAAERLRTIVEAETFVAAVAEVARGYAANDSPSTVPFEFTVESRAAHDAARSFLEAELIGRRQRLEGLRVATAAGTVETAEDRRMVATDRQALGVLLETDIALIESTLRSLSLSERIDRLQVAVQHAVTAESARLMRLLSDVQDRRHSRRRRRVGMRRGALLGVAIVFVLMGVFSDRALSEVWVSVLGSVILGIGLWGADRYRETRMERRSWVFRLKLLIGEVEGAARYLVMLRREQARHDEDRALRGLQPSALTAWSNWLDSGPDG